MLGFIKLKSKTGMIKVIKPGFYSTIQDLGRYAYQDFGVPYAGVMDQLSAQLANHILGNNLNDAVLEITMKGPELEFLSPTLICVSGAQMNPMLNKTPVHMNKMISVEKGTILSFGKLESGVRCYLSVRGGFQTELIMRSRSMYSGITKQITISKGDELEIGEVNRFLADKNAHVKVNAHHISEHVIEAYEGPEFSKLSKEAQHILKAQEFTISNDNSRMAYQLKELLQNDLDAILTTPVLPGTVQLTPSGKLIVLMRDCQTTGGYPRVLQLSSQAINVLSQKLTGTKIKFKIVSIEF
ncbi:5-oxoprolinase subunit C family protein [Gaetbulibacter saemankumensis]|uniref:5-oxoprolinase subunit C family protein n=1 Tax=Gaetbulibacter saemankumensis TaxID=311208 RepID=UPI001FDFD70B|nr:biotin-dependent carboxyltransferase family protein [Gaetbulibacter saemankumensis]